MTEIDPEVQAAVAAHNEGRYAEALALQQALFARAEREDAPGRSPYFMAVFGWQMLLPVYPPAHPVLQALRDEQARHWLAGDVHFGPPIMEGRFERKSRFTVIVELNELLGDPQFTCALFAGLDRSDAARARQYAHRALPALVAAQAWALADRYRGDPLAMLEECNALRHSFPLFAPAQVAPRLGAALMSLVRDVCLGAAVLEGLGDAPAAIALRAALVDGIEDAAMRELAQRELAVPGTITLAITDRQMAQDGPA